MVKKRIPGEDGKERRAAPTWLEVESLAEIELTSEDPEYPIDLAIVGDENDRGWLASNPGENHQDLFQRAPAALSHPSGI